MSDCCCDCCLTSGAGDMAADMTANLAPPKAAAMDRDPKEVPLLPNSTDNAAGLVVPEPTAAAPTPCRKCKDSVGEGVCFAGCAYTTCFLLQLAKVMHAPWIV